MEIGPGLGSLTEAVLRCGATVLAIEKDDVLHGHLKQKFSQVLLRTAENQRFHCVYQRVEALLLERLRCAPQEPAVSLIHSDVLLLRNIRDVLDDFGGGEEGPSIKMVANIPYNITSGACSH